jgi:hypothetical protein
LANAVRRVGTFVDSAGTVVQDVRDIVGPQASSDDYTYDGGEFVSGPAPAPSRPAWVLPALLVGGAALLATGA